MTVFGGVVVPAIPPQPPKLSLLTSAIRPGSESDPPINDANEISPEQLAALPVDLRTEINARKGAAWTRGFTYAPENHWLAEIRDGCDFTSIDLPAVPAPTGLAATPSVSGGSLTAGLKSYRITAINANGETTPSAAVTPTTTGSAGSVALVWDRAAENLQYKVYGRISGSEGLLAVVGPFDVDQAPTWTDDGSRSAGAAAPSTNTTAGIGSYTNAPVNTVIPPLLVVEDFCSASGFEQRDFKGRALRLLDNATPQALEKEFWTGALATAKGYPNRFLTDANIVDLTPGAGPPSIARGLQILQGALATCGFGGQGMIHVQAQTAPNLLSVRRVGNLLYDIFDNLVVPGVGYPGTGPGGAAPAAGTAWMYATDLVAARVEDEGTVFPDTFAEATDRSQDGSPNTIRFRAEKFGVAYWDGACQFGVRVTLAT